MCDDRFFLLSQTDALWKQHLGAIKFLQQAVGLRGYASKDPLTEFKLEGYNLFVEMTSQVWAMLCSVWEVCACGFFKRVGQNGSPVSHLLRFGRSPSLGAVPVAVRVAVGMLE